MKSSMAAHSLPAPLLEVLQGHRIAREGSGKCAPGNSAEQYTLPSLEKRQHLFPFANNQLCQLVCMYARREIGNAVGRSSTSFVTIWPLAPQEGIWAFSFLFSPFPQTFLPSLPSRCFVDVLQPPVMPCLNVGFSAILKLQVPFFKKENKAVDFCCLKG